jgi:hypothetical protein
MSKIDKIDIIATEIVKSLQGHKGYQDVLSSMSKDKKCREHQWSIARAKEVLDYGLPIGDLQDFRAVRFSLIRADMKKPRKGKLKDKDILKAFFRLMVKAAPVDLVMLTNEVREGFEKEGLEPPSSIPETLVVMLDKYGFQSF